MRRPKLRSYALLNRLFCRIGCDPAFRINNKQIRRNVCYFLEIYHSVRTRNNIANRHKLKNWPATPYPPRCTFPIRVTTYFDQHRLDFVELIQKNPELRTGSIAPPEPFVQRSLTQKKRKKPHAFCQPTKFRSQFQLSSIGHTRSNRDERHAQLVRLQIRRR